jgi:hypothetical protein
MAADCTSPPWLTIILTRQSISDPGLPVSRNISFQVSHFNCGAGDRRRIPLWCAFCSAFACSGNRLNPQSNKRRTKRLNPRTIRGRSVCKAVAFAHRPKVKAPLWPAPTARSCCRLNHKSTRNARTIHSYGWSQSSRPLFAIARSLHRDRPQYS